MKCGNCGSTDIEIHVGQERDGYEGVTICHECERVRVAYGDSTAEVSSRLEEMLAEKEEPHE